MSGSGSASDPGTRRTVPTELGHLAVASRGAGPDVVLVHGFGADSADWAPVAGELVERGHRVHLLDLPGHGRSSLSWRAVDVDGLARSVAAVVVALDLRQALLGGHSLGGMAVLALTARQPALLADRVRGQVLVATTASLRLPAELASYALGTSLSSRALLSIPSVGNTAVRAALFAPRAPVELVERARLTAAATPIRTRWAFAKGVLEADLDDDLARVDLPTVVVCGRRDRVTPPARARGLADGIRGARLVLVPGAGHAVTVEQPATVAAAFDLLR